jgi:hypothetical protein
MLSTAAADSALQPVCVCRRVQLTSRTENMSAVEGHPAAVLMPMARWAVFQRCQGAASGMSWSLLRKCVILQKARKRLLISIVIVVLMPLLAYLMRR